MPEQEASSDAGRVVVGHPVDVASGAVFTVQDDFQFPGTIPLVWRRHYSTDSPSNSWLGRCWTVPYFMTLEHVPEGYRLLTESGSHVVFPAAPEGLPVGGSIASLGANMQLKREESHFCIDHWHWGTEDVERFYFQASSTAVMSLAWLENLAGHRISIQFDARQRPWRVKQELEGRVVELSYSVDNVITAIYFLAASGSRTLLSRYEYSGERHLTVAANALDARTKYEYDSAHRMLSETNPLGSTFAFAYDKQGRCIHTTGTNGYFERRLQYLSAPRRTRVTDSLGATSEYIVNDAGLVIQEVSPLGASWTTEYDSHGRPVALTDPLGAVVQHKYDSFGNREVIVHEDGAESRFIHNDKHVLMEYVSPTGHNWVYERDEKGYPVGLINPLGHRLTCIRDPQELVIKSTSPGGLEITRRYGPETRWVEASDQISLLSRVEYDEAGNQVAAYDAAGLLQRVQFDAVNRPVAAEDANGGVYRFQWNAIGQLVERTGPDIGWEARTYDQFGQLTKHTNPLGELRLEYDTEGRLIAVVNRSGERLERRYDADSRVVAELTFDGRLETCEYNPRGEPIRVPKPDGRELWLTFDKTGALIKRESSDGLLEEFAFDKDGLLVAARTRDTSVRLERNAVGGIVAEIQNGRRIEYDYDPDGNRTARRIVGVPGGSLTRRNDVRGRITKLVDDAGVCLEFRWDDVNRLIERRSPSGVLETLDYDRGGRLEKQQVASGHGMVVDRHYDYDAMDNIRVVDDRRRGKAELSYDMIGRVTKVAKPGATEERYRYDANGTILETHRGRRTIASGGRTLDDGQRDLEYDLNGCVVTIAEQQARTDLEYDIDGRLVRARSSRGDLAEYTYDGLGRRASKAVNGAKTEFVWEGCVLAAESRDDKLEEQVYFLALEPVAQWKAEGRLFPVTGPGGAVYEVLDHRGALQWECSLESYGLLISESGTPSSPFRLRGQYYDAETGLHYNFHRTYDPALGNYLSPDPIGIEGGANYYLYPRNPLLWDDPFGLKCGKPAKHAEEKMDKHFQGKGYSKVSVKGKNLNANGIDAIYHNPNAVPPAPKYIIAEAKSGCAVLRWSGPGKATQQMSDAWINGAPGNASQGRLEAALPPVMDQHGQPQPNPHLVAIQSAPQGDVGKRVYHPDKSPPVTRSGDYGGGNSSTQTF